MTAVERRWQVHAPAAVVVRATELERTSELHPLVKRVRDVVQHDEDLEQVPQNL